MSEDKLIGKIKESMANDFAKIESLADLEKKINDKIANFSSDPKGNNDLHTIGEFVTHLSDCNNDDCAIHKIKSDAQSKAWIGGFASGSKFNELLSKLEGSKK